jgi:FkbM family methyltransferase
MYYDDQGTDRYLREVHFPDYNTRGVIVEIGAGFPDRISVSAHFRESGWRVVGIEPNPDFCKLFQERGYEIYNYACADYESDDVDFVVVDVNWGLSHSALCPRHIETAHLLAANIPMKTIKVKVRTLDTVLDIANVPVIDVLSVDVEGWELDVMRGFSLQRRKPRLVVMENMLKDPAYEPYMQERGYRLLHKTQHNDVFCPQ